MKYLSRRARRTRMYSSPEQRPRSLFFFYAPTHASSVYIHIYTRLSPQHAQNGSILHSEPSDVGVIFFGLAAVI